MVDTPTFSKAEEQLVNLPGKLQNVGDYNNNSDKYSVLLNAYHLKLENVVDNVFKHELKFYCYMEPKTLNSGKVLDGKWKELWKGPKNDVSNRLRNRLNYNLFKKLIDLNQNYFGRWDPTHKSPIHGYAYDCSTIIFSLISLVDEGREKEFIIDRNEIDEESLAYIGSDRIGHFKGVISGYEYLNVRNLNSVSEDRNRNIVQFLDVLFNQYVYQKDLYFVFPSKMFKKDGQISLQDDPRVIMSGMQKNVRIVGDDSSNVRSILQIDAKKAAFYPAIDVYDFVKGMLSRRSHENFDLEDRVYSGNSLSLIRKHLKGISVETCHSKSKNIFVVNGVTDEPASRIEFNFRGKNISVAEYYFETYNIRLRHPNLPCLIEKKPKRKDGSLNDAYYPLEFLKICEGQRVPFDKQTPKLVEQMIRNCQAKPVQFCSNTNSQKSEAFLSNSNPFIKAFKLGVANELDKTPATILHAPTVKYNDRTMFDIQNRDPSWKQFVTKFLVPAQVGRWVFCALQKCLPDQLLNNFADQYVQTAKQHGMLIDRPSHFQRFETDTIDELRRFMAMCKNNGVRFLICITKDKLDPFHNSLKLVEVEFDIITQHIWAENVQKSVDQPNRKMTLINIIMKSNLKLGGINYGLYTSQTFSKANPNVTHDIVDKEWLRESRMFIGIDFSHAAPQTLYERQANIPCSEPTVVGMAYTTGVPQKILGKYWYQEPRVAYVQKLDAYVVDALLQYQAQQNRFPQHIVVYRSGASEGEYRIAVTYEQKAFERAFEKLMQDHGMRKKPFLTIIVVQRNSNYRVIPQDPRGDKPFLQNVPSGTCVDRDVLHPTQTEFLLVAHKTIQGTARPIRCTVIWDDHKPRIKLEELEYVTYTLCFAHGIVCSPVSVPAPLYSAADLAKRGRNNYKAVNDNNGGGRGKIGRYERLDEDDATYFDRMSADLRNSLNTKYWA